VDSNISILPRSIPKPSQELLDRTAQAEGSHRPLPVQTAAPTHNNDLFASQPDDLFAFDPDDEDPFDTWYSIF
jgi:hypothetical protein